jgi:xanthine/uracil permease
MPGCSFLPNERYAANVLLPCLAGLTLLFSGEKKKLSFSYDLFCCSVSTFNFLIRRRAANCSLPTSIFPQITILHNKYLIKKKKLFNVFY